MAGPLRFRGRTLVALFAATAFATAASCSSDSGDTASGDGDGPCAWVTRGDRETFNIAYPDAAATYWAVSYDLAPGETLELDGRFPSARYASFITYGPYGGVVDVLTDVDITAADGDTNPFDDSVESSDDAHQYTVIVGNEDADDAANLMNATAAPGSDAATRIADIDPDADESTASDPGAENLLGSGGGEGTPGILMYRVYVPDDAADASGGVGLPAITVVGTDGDREAVPTCDEPGPNPRGLELTEAYGPPTDREAPPQPVFVRPEAGAANLFPNPDNVYIATIAEHRPGQVVVMRATAPTFPDATVGRPVGTGEQVRFWSLCTNEYRKPYPVSHCLVDRDVVLDAAGRFVVVTSTPEDRPTNATEGHGVTWLEWGPTDVDNLLLLRHMLADPSFTESAIHMDHGAVALTAMGPYAPESIYCAVEVVERDGPDACFE